MNFSIRGDKFEVTDAIRDYAKDKVSKIEKYFDSPEKVNAKILFSVKGREQRVEITINGGHFDLRAEVSHSDMYAAIDLAVDKLEGQMRKFKTKLMNHDKGFVFEDFGPEIEEVSEEIAKRKKVFLKPMDEEEAITQMEMLGHTFFVFKNQENDSVCVAYKRIDGRYGIIETN